MRRRDALCAALAATLVLPRVSSAQKGVAPTSVMVGGKPLVSDRSIMENLSASGIHTTFAALLRTAGLEDTLARQGPFTVFAPTDQAFAALPEGVLQGLRQPGNRDRLIALLGLEIVEGNYSLNRFHYLLRSGKGQTVLESVSHAELTVSTNGPANLVVRTTGGESADILLYDVKAANGVIFVTDRVLGAA